MIQFLLFSILAFAQIDGTTVTCPKGKYSNVGDMPRLRFLSNKSHILVCGKGGKKEGKNFFLNEFEVYYYHPFKKRIMPALMTTRKYERFRIYSVERSLFFEELAYTGAKRVPVFRNSILCANDGVCTFASMECVFDKKKNPIKFVTKILLERLEKANCL